MFVCFIMFLLSLKGKKKSSKVNVTPSESWFSTRTSLEANIFHLCSKLRETINLDSKKHEQVLAVTRPQVKLTC